MSAYDPLQVLATSRFFSTLSRNYQAKAADLAAEWSAGREISAEEAAWLEVLNDYSETLALYSERAEATVHGWEAVLNNEKSS